MVASQCRKHRILLVNTVVLETLRRKWPAEMDSFCCVASDRRNCAASDPETGRWSAETADPSWGQQGQRGQASTDSFGRVWLFGLTSMKTTKSQVIRATCFRGTSKTMHWMHCFHTVHQVPSHVQLPKYLIFRVYPRAPKYIQWNHLSLTSSKPY